MSNDAMTAPTEEQAISLKHMEMALEGAVGQAKNISILIGKLRNELNNSRLLLGSLKGAIGPHAYQYNSAKSFHSLIEDRLAQIDAVLK